MTKLKDNKEYSNKAMSADNGGGSYVGMYLVLVKL